MPLNPPDDFGFSRAPHLRTRKAPGIFTPRHLIGQSISDLPGERSHAPEIEVEPETAPQTRFSGIRDLVRLATSRRQNKAPVAANDDDAATPAASSTPRREPAATSTPRKGISFGTPAKTPGKKQVAFTNMMESQLDELVFGHDIDLSGRSKDRDLQEKAQENRRLKRIVVGPDGKPMDAQKASDPRGGKQSSIRHIPYTPTPQKHCHDGSKRQYSWIHRPTAWENPVSYEDPPEPGKRPTHPVCSVGLVATDRKRCYPEKSSEMGLILMDPPSDPAPGRDLEDERPEVKSDTAWLTNWHWDSRYDCDPPKQNKYSLGVPIEGCSTTRSETVHRQAAGKKSNLQAEGCALSFYEQVRKMDQVRGMGLAQSSAR